jgi:hypothetical protein
LSPCGDACDGREISDLTAAAKREVAARRRNAPTDAVQTISRRRSPRLIRKENLPLA